MFFLVASVAATVTIPSIVYEDPCLLKPPQPKLPCLTSWLPVLHLGAQRPEFKLSAAAVQQWQWQHDCR